MSPHVLTRRACVLAGLALATGAVATSGRTPPPEIAATLPGAQLRGQGRLRWFGLAVYDARLWSDASGPEDLLQRPFALELQYARAFKGEKIAERSIEEMTRIGAMSADRAELWLESMKRLFPDVAAGDRLTGVQRNAEALFFHNGSARGGMSDAEFTRLFFGIWLSPRTGAPALREQLLGLRSGSSS